MTKYIKLVSMFAGFSLVIGCTSKGGYSSPPASGGTCAAIKAGVPLSGRGCVSDSGKWTSYDVIESTSDTMATTPSASYMMYCNASDNAHYTSQANFDANEGTSVSPSVKITSNEDYVSTATCVSGSIFYDDGSTKDKHTFIWMKQP